MAACVVALIVVGIVAAGWQAWRNYCEFLRDLGDDEDQHHV